MKIPYPMQAAVTTHRRHEQMLAALKTGLPRLKQVPIDETKTLNIAAYGPSLRDTWRELEHPILSMSGATRFLAENGVIADYHCDMDPRLHKQKFIDPPAPGVHYLMATICHPGTWDILKDERVTLWHTMSCHGCTMQFVAEFDPGALVVNPGSTIGLAALHLGGVLGYRHFEVHGMDGSFKDGERHAGKHYGKVQKDAITWDVFNKTYRTSKIMSNGVSETMNQLAMMPICCVFHGEGLTQALVRKQDLPNACCADQTAKAAKIRAMRPRVVALGGTPEEQKAATSPFDALLKCPPPEWVIGLAKLAEAAETRRALARFDTGTLSLDSMLFLRALVEVQKPEVVVEIGTFIGSSTLAMQAGLHQWNGEIYTCDKDNDCLPADGQRTCYPYTTSTEMLADLVQKGVKADLFFFDGRIQLPDLPLILRLSRRRTVYAFDDYVGKEKGVANVELLGKVLPSHALVKPWWKDGVTIALLVPRP